jgi:hypothetical protein
MENFQYRQPYWKQDIHYNTHKRMLFVLFGSILLALMFFAVARVSSLMGSVGASFVIAP